MPEKRSWHSAAHVTSLLDPLRYEMSAGMSDEEVARRTQLPIRTVQRWRLREGLKRPRGLLSKQLETVHAISGFGEILGDVKQRTRHSPVLGAWQPPMFAVREHLDYDQFLRVLDAAYRIAGMSITELQRGLGLTRASVEQGLAIHERQSKEARKCKTCGGPVDPGSRDFFCTQLCEKLYAR